MAIFIGAGLSKSSETKLFKIPSWNELIHELKTDLETNENDFLKIAQLYFLAFGEFSYYKKLQAYFPDYIKPSKIHHQVFEINPHVILTTNWDTILEKTIEEGGYIYDVICSDKDLVKSNLDTKLVKIHGDFKNHNIVFKEDDYLKYSLNFPLIENYVKSILSTHTVLFLGYSYSDVDLKQIVKWIEHYSDVRPPKYIISHRVDVHQEKYFKNHGIYTIFFNEISEEIKENDTLSERSKKVYSFLQKINSQVLNTDSPEAIVEYVLSKIIHLNTLESIFMEQIQSAFSNCGFLFDDDERPILEFYKGQVTYDYDKKIRTFYNKFIEVLRKEKFEINQETDKKQKEYIEQKIKTATGKKRQMYENILSIIRILSKANIKGIIISKDEDTDTLGKEYLPFNIFEDFLSENKTNYLNFHFEITKRRDQNIFNLFDLSFKQYHAHKYEEAFYLMEDAIALCLKQRNYIWLFIAMFNRDFLLHNLKYGLKRFENKEKFKNLKTRCSSICLYESKKNS